MHVIVVGAGLLGVSTAYFLRLHGADVTVLDREEGAARGASFGNGGYLQSSVPDPWNAPGVLKVFLRAWISNLVGRGDLSAFNARTSALPALFGWGTRFLRNSNRKIFLDHLTKNFHLAQYTRTVLASLGETERLSYFRSTAGGLIVFRSEESMSSYLEIADFMASHGARFERLDRSALVAKEPSLSDTAGGIVGALHFPDDVSGNSRIFCEQLASIAAARGVVFRYEEHVRRISKSENCVVIDTQEDTVVGDAVVIAAGAQSKRLAKPLGIQLPVVPAKGYSLSIPMNGWANRPAHMIADLGVHAGINPLGDVLRVAGTAEFAGFRVGVTAERTRYMIGLVEQIFPSFAKTIDPSTIEPWGGHRPLCADGIPIIGSTRIPNVYVNTGHGGLGWTQAAGSGKALAEHILNIDGGFDLKVFSLGRFQQ